ncbi:hypothetical protein AVDCRST_MAG94-2911 [uncultured Leptolyngbya sp.]|uniref:Uncharacterized protein n=1 Tax=uncultured Leptolyngbya sp. TaxID=332963 RepID=A0A6J4M899_9CYAN|nr:hypothetical protein AVDCRST_MAG94-2911 [uncultured Leptolyngbya sp.]
MVRLDKSTFVECRLTRQRKDCNKLSSYRLLPALAIAAVVFKIGNKVSDHARSLKFPRTSPL